VPRPRTISDQRLLDATATVIGRAGPGFTLAQVAAEAGVAVGTVAGRFASKAGLLEALGRAGVSRAVAAMGAAARAAADPVSGLRAALVAFCEPLGDAETAANHLGQLGVDLSTLALRRLLGAQYAAIEGTLRTLVAAAAAELPRAPVPPRAARVLLAVVNGVSLDWSIRPEGPLAVRVAEDVDAVLDAWRDGRTG
jgi:AcrR family transcriptional regulator